MRLRAPHVRLGVRYLIVLIALGLAVAPIYWMIVTSLTPSAALYSGSPRLFPDGNNVGVYWDVLSSGTALGWIRNSVLIATGTLVFSVLLAVPAAYVLSRFKYKILIGFGFGLFLTQMIPEALLVVPLYSVFQGAGLLNSLLGLALANAAFSIPIIAWILKSAIDGVPRELEEAAQVDGCTRIRVLDRIVVPVILPTIAACSVIAFFNGWNEYVFAVTFIMDESLQPASVGLASFVGQFSTPLDVMMTVGVLYTLPAVCFYFVAQRYVVSGMAAGAVKG